MNKRSVPFLGLAAILSQLNLLGACASASDPKNGGGSGSSGTGSAGTSSGAGTGGSDSTGTAGSGASTAGSSAAGSTGTSGAGGAPVSPDPSCMSNSTAKEGAMCTQDCMVECGYHGIGKKTCTCGNGIFTQCHCPRPPEYMGAATAGYCMTPDGTTTTLNKTPCTTEWDQCVGKDVVSSVTPQGCACMKDTTGTLTWVCGSTNQWYKLAM